MVEIDDRYEIGRERQRALLHDLRHYVAAGLLLFGDGDDGLTELELRSRLRTGQLLFHQLSAVVDREAVGVDPPPGPIDVGELVEDCVSIFRHGHPGLRVRMSVRDELACAIDREQLHRALTNVVENAARAAGDRGLVTVQAWADTGDALVEVTDDGRGFGQISHGSGHGLQCVDDVVRSAHGQLEIRSGPDAGTRVRLVIPMVDTEVGS
jgi:signal transduction histidine kinase